jgi:hypothetical protein
MATEVLVRTLLYGGSYGRRGVGKGLLFLNAGPRGPVNTKAALLEWRQFSSCVHKVQGSSTSCWRHTKLKMLHKVYTRKHGPPAVQGFTNGKHLNGQFTMLPYLVTAPSLNSHKTQTVPCCLCAMAQIMPASVTRMCVRWEGSTANKRGETEDGSARSGVCKALVANSKMPKHPARDAQRRTCCLLS